MSSGVCGENLSVDIVQDSKVGKNGNMPSGGVRGQKSLPVPPEAMWIGGKGDARQTNVPQFCIPCGVKVGPEMSWEEHMKSKRHMRNERVQEIRKQL